MAEIINPTDWKSNAKKRRIRQLVNTTWLQILELYPDRSAAVHMVNILRSKGAVTGTTSSGAPSSEILILFQMRRFLRLWKATRKNLTEML